jgi:ubiquitin carboxyl-terminal hydrolase 8
MLNPIGTKGQLANAFAGILQDMWRQDQTYLTPTSFRVSSSFLGAES